MDDVTGLLWRILAGPLCAALAPPCVCAPWANQGASPPVSKTRAGASSAAAREMGSGGSIVTARGADHGVFRLRWAAHRACAYAPLFRQFPRLGFGFPNGLSK